MKNNIFKVLVCTLLCGTSVQANLGSIDPTEFIDANEFRCCYNAYQKRLGKSIEHQITNKEAKTKLDNGKWANWQEYINYLGNDEQRKDFVEKHLKSSYPGRSWACAGDKGSILGRVNPGGSYYTRNSPQN